MVRERYRKGEDMLAAGFLTVVVFGVYPLVAFWWPLWMKVRDIFLLPGPPELPPGLAIAFFFPFIAIAVGIILTIRGYRIVRHRDREATSLKRRS